MTPLANRLALITGASAGIGEACAYELAALGASVVLNARRADRLHAVAKAITSGAFPGAKRGGAPDPVDHGGPYEGTASRPPPPLPPPPDANSGHRASRGGGDGRPRAVIAPGDAADDATIELMFAVAEREFGRTPDIVVINAGRGLRGSPLTSDPGQWEDVIRVNLLGAARLLRASAERMLKDAAAPAPRAASPDRARGGAHAGPGAQALFGLRAEREYSNAAAHQQARSAAEAAPRDWPSHARDIVMLSSTVGRHISPFSSMYGATKFGVTSMAEAARREIGPRGVRISCIHPGVVASEFQEVAGYDPVTFGEFMERISPTLSPEDVARTIGFIVSQPPGVCINDVMLRPTRQEYP